MSVTSNGFARNVAKTVSLKNSRESMKYSAKKTLRVKLSRFGIGLAASVDGLVASQRDYILGRQMSDEDKEQAVVYLGEVGAALVSLCKLLKIKIPSANKKSRLKCSRATGLLNLHGISMALLQEVYGFIFWPLPKVPVTKEIMVPITGTKEVREVMVLDENAMLVSQDAQFGAIAFFLKEEMIPLYWSLCFDITGKPPSYVMEEKLTRMINKFPGIKFDTVEEETPAAA